MSSGVVVICCAWGRVVACRGVWWCAVLLFFFLRKLHEIFSDCQKKKNKINQPYMI